MQGWEAVPVAGGSVQLRINTTAPVYGYAAGVALCLSLDLCQSHVTVSPCNSTPPATKEGPCAAKKPGAANFSDQYWRVGKGGALVNGYNGLCLTDFGKGTTGTAECGGAHASKQQWAHAGDSAPSAIHFAGTGSGRCLELSPTNGGGQVYGRLLSDGVMLVFFNAAPVSDADTTTAALPTPDDTRRRHEAPDDTPRELCCDAACWAELQLQAGGQLKQGAKLNVRDAWAHSDNGTAVVGQALCVAWPAAESSTTLRLTAAAAE